MTRSAPSPALEWLIGALGKVSATPSKIERIQRAGLGPRPLHHRHDTLSGADLWPEGAVEHYAAVIPLIKQRHAAKEIAAITMIGWGFPVDLQLLRQAYARAYDLDRIDDLEGRLVSYYQERGMPIFKQVMSNVRSHGLAGGWDAGDLADELLRAAASYLRGNAMVDQTRLMLEAALPKFNDAPAVVIDWVIGLFNRIQEEFSLSKILETVNGASIEQFLAAQVEASKDFDIDIERVGGLDRSCQSCNETRGFMIGCWIPFRVRFESFDWSPLLDELANELPRELQT